MQDGCSEEECSVQFGIVNSVSGLFRLLAMFDGGFEIIMHVVHLKCEKRIIAIRGFIQSEQVPGSRGMLYRWIFSVKKLLVEIQECQLRQNAGKQDSR